MSGKSGLSGDSIGAGRSEPGDTERTSAPQSREGGEEEGKGRVAARSTGGGGEGGGGGGRGGTTSEGEVAAVSMEDIGKQLPHVPPTPPLFDRMLHDEDDEEEEMVFEVWVASASSHCSVATVIEYCGQFISIEVHS